jgi:drug/metabolite transporter (DMT)-like permease
MMVTLMERAFKLWKFGQLVNGTGTLKTYISLVLIVLFSSSGNIFLSQGMKQIGAVQVGSAMDLVRLLLGVFRNGWIWMGIAALLLFLGCFMVVLSWADYSFISPASASAYIVVPLVGHFLLGEKVPPLHWLGIMIICVGVGLVRHTAPNTTRAK